MPEGFNHSMLMFLPKETAADDEEEHDRKPEDTRPLCLSNTDAKLVASATGHSLNECASRCVTAEQAGFIRGRSMTGNILTIEAQALAFAASPAVKTGGILPFDFGAAFPSVAHAWIMFVLARMHLPDEIVTIIMNLYSDCK